ncbi:hypothetical protein JCM11641_002458 [Rhodosporidiobolus odoratus]
MLAPFLALPLLPLASAGYSYYSIDNLPHTSEQGQQGYNDCGSADSPSSMCQTAHVNSVTDFCLWAPPSPGPTIGSSEEYEVTWCTASGHGARVMPAGTIKSAHYLSTPKYTQVTGTGDFTKINIQAGDEGGELDPHGATGLGNPIGSLVYANGQQIHEWTSFISDTEFCFRVCHDASDAWLYCQHVYDVMGCAWNEPGNYGEGFDQCEGEPTSNPPGIYTGDDGQVTTFSQGDGHTPPAMAPGASSNCQGVATVGGNAVAAVAATTTASSSSVASSSVPSASSVVSTGTTLSSLPISSSSLTVPLSSSTSSTVVPSSFTTSTVSSSASSSESSSLSSVVSSSGSVSVQSVSTITQSSTLSSASLPVSTGQRAAASASQSSSTSGSIRHVAGVFGSLVGIVGALAFFA